MASYRYKAMSRTGRMIRGIMTIKDENALFCKLKAEGSCLIDAKQVNNRKQYRRFHAEHLSRFCKETGVLITSGVPLAKSVELLSQNEHCPAWERNIYGNLLKDLRQGRLFSDAMENGQRLFPERIQKMEINWVEQTKPLEYLVVTNKQGINGAAALFYPGVLERLGEQFPGGFYLIPTSIHEFILEFEQRGLPLETMEESLKGTNQGVTYSKDQLSNEVYHYDPSRACFERAKTYQKRFMN